MQLGDSLDKVESSIKTLKQTDLDNNRIQKLNSHNLELFDPDDDEGDDLTKYPTRAHLANEVSP